MDEEYDYDAGVCEECRINGNDYYTDAQGDIVCACSECIMNETGDYWG